MGEASGRAGLHVFWGAGFAMPRLMHGATPQALEQAFGRWKEPIYLWRSNACKLTTAAKNMFVSGKNIPKRLAELTEAGRFESPQTAPKMPWDIYIPYWYRCRYAGPKAS